MHKQWEVQTLIERAKAFYLAMVRALAVKCSLHTPVAGSFVRTKLPATGRAALVDWLPCLGPVAILSWVLQGTRGG
jgi:hypothetical protein